ncbi:MAG: L-glutamate gamma-semialdehyde dehydrogenase, partial [Gammaproteobacteria bacterium]|nr:L-glutamate gamma-semialdehyde dehydrogenase [Gammaproteobacteria bacterium]
RLGEPVIRAALKHAMAIMGQQFVMGQTMAEALARAEADDARRYRYSFDMLGEAALTADDARRYLDAYSQAIAAVGRAGPHLTDPSVSVKLSALCPRFEYGQAARAIAELSDKLGQLALEAQVAGIALTVDAEEADRLELTLAVFRNVRQHAELADWSGFGIAVQAYQKRARPVIAWLEALARETKTTIPVRLVKGAYWDSEIKRAQEQGLDGYPVFTRKSSTDVSYLACAKALLAASPALYPQFATHNAHTVAWIEQQGRAHEFEFQRLHGMGRALYSTIVDEPDARPCRVYAPVGSHEALLPYLVRRLLENGANTSFVNRIVDEDEAIEDIIRDPVAETESLGARVVHSKIPLPRDLYAPARTNSAGINFADSHALGSLAAGLEAADLSRVGRVESATPMKARDALAAAHAAFPAWNARAATDRAAVLREAAKQFEARRADLVALITAEGRRTVPDGVAEVREAVDFLRYYANEAERIFAVPAELPGPTGERNTLRLTGRGVFLCISPWNFPAAIFTGQIAAALAAGNTVLAKPAEQTPAVAALAVDLLHEAGVPKDALTLLPGSGPEIGGAVLGDARLAGVAFTGSVEPARHIQRALAARDGPLATLIAETGGINAMIVDSSALAEQVVRDTVQSAFNSAGQRCSALRLLCLQHETADEILEMLTGHMAELVIGDPAWLATDVGPVIDEDARHELADYIAAHAERIVYQCPLPGRTDRAGFVPPTVIAVDRVADLEREVFGPVLHVVCYDADDVDRLVDEINATGFGLTLGIHSRIDDVAERIAARARVGNVYVNRNMIGAVVGVQPFGGMGLSGTGPKAGGPHYVARFATEQ